MNITRLGLSTEQQAEIDLMFLETSIEALYLKQKYGERALMCTDTPDLPNELEAIHGRVFDLAHIAIIAARDIAPVTIKSLANLTFIDTLMLPSAEKVEHRTAVLDRKVLTGRSDVERGLGYWNMYRRLFRGLAHAE